MTIQHAVITDPLVHEPKGASTAAIGTVYISDGAGSGSWTLPGVNQYLTFTGVITDVSTAGSIYIPIPTACFILGATTVLGAAITVADSIITFFNSASASLGSATTVAFTGSAAGTIDTFAATTNTSLGANTYVRVTTDGGSTTTAPLYVTLLCAKAVTA